MDPFASGATASALLPPALRDRQRVAAARLVGASLPSWEEEVWRYSPIDELDFVKYEPAVPDLDLVESAVAALDAARVEIGADVAGAVTVHNGQITGLFGDLVTHGAVSADDGAESLVGSLIGDTGDIFSAMTHAYGFDPVVITVPRNRSVLGPIVVVNTFDHPGIAAFPRLVIDAGENSEVNVVDVYRCGDIEAFVAPVVEVRCGPAARVGYVTRQELGPRVWQIGTQVSQVEQQGTFRSSVAAFGGGYARTRTDCFLTGRGAHGDLDAIYFGNNEQVLDFRTFQDHGAPDTTSNLLFKGVVDDKSRSIYTGLIRVNEEAAGTKAFQTNRNIKLSDDAWAESVPNLEIETNDVKCSHASTVGPIDEEQRFYLESRGVPSAAADKLIVGGFFDEVIDDLPVASAEAAIRELIESKLEVSSVG